MLVMVGVVKGVSSDGGEEEECVNSDGAEEVYVVIVGGREVCETECSYNYRAACLCSV